MMMMMMMKLLLDCALPPSPWGHPSLTLNNKRWTYQKNGAGCWASTRAFNSTPRPVTSCFDWLLSVCFRANALHCGSWRKRNGGGGGAPAGSGSHRRCPVLGRFGYPSERAFWVEVLSYQGRMRSEESSDLEWGRMEQSSVRRSLETLCQELNMDEETATEALENFTAILNTYTLEVRRTPADLTSWTTGNFKSRPTLTMLNKRLYVSSTY